MFRDVERIAADSELHFLGHRAEIWTYFEDSPHIASFLYDLAIRSDRRDDENQDEFTIVGAVDGYRIAHDWTIGSELQIWDEADALDQDAVCYVEALIRETRACQEVFGCPLQLTDVQRITIIRHVEAVPKYRSSKLLQNVAACLAMMDAPNVMLVDPWPMPTERRSAKGKLKGRSHIPALLDLGFVRMVGSRFLWAWNCELAESSMAEYSYAKLIRAKSSGRLRHVLEASIASEVHGALTDELATMLGVPKPDDIEKE